MKPDLEMASANGVVMANDLASELTGYIVQHCGLSASRINDDALLFSTGALDSFSLIDIVTFLEQKTGLKVRPRDLEFGNFDSVSRMVAYVARHG